MLTRTALLFGAGSLAALSTTAFAQGNSTRVEVPAGRFSTLTISQLEFVLRYAGQQLPESLLGQPGESLVVDVVSDEDAQFLLGLWDAAGRPPLDFSDLPDPAPHLEAVRLKEIAESSPSFGGFWFDSGTNTVHVALTSTDEFEDLKSDIVNVSLDAVDHTYPALADALEKTSVLLEKAGVAADLRVDERNNRVEVLPYAGFRGRVIETLPDTIVDDEILTLSPNDIGGGTTTTVIGGLTLSGGCTSGFVGHGGFGYAILTAGHCSNGRQDTQGTSLGPALAQEFFGNYDRQLHAVDQPGDTGANYVRVGSGSNREITGMIPFVDVYDGMGVWKRGRITGYLGGEVLDRCYDFSYIPGSGCNVRTDIWSKPGDSGGPWILNNAGVAITSGCIRAVSSPSCDTDPGEFNDAIGVYLNINFQNTGYDLYTGKWAAMTPTFVNLVMWFGAACGTVAAASCGDSDTAADPTTLDTEATSSTEVAARETPVATGAGNTAVLAGALAIDGSCVTIEGTVVQFDSSVEISKRGITFDDGTFVATGSEVEGAGAYLTPDMPMRTTPGASAEGCLEGVNEYFAAEGPLRLSN